ncbi:MAG TPA: bifunctional diguanylate cyclase/phosphodiesterase [Acidimicrobiales bacterium]
MHRWGHIWFLIAGFAAIVAYYALPEDTAALTWIYQGVGLAAAGAIVAGIWLHRPRRPGAWYAAAAGILLFSAGDAVWAYYELVGGDVPLISVADVFYLAGYPALALGVVWFVRARRPGRDMEALIDGVVIGLGVAMIGWLVLIRPVLGDPAISLRDTIVSGAYPAGDLALLTVVGHLLLGPRSTSRAFWLFVSGIIVMLVGDTAYLLQVHTDSYILHGWLDASWLGSYVLMGAAALDPTMRDLTKWGSTERAQLPAARVALLGGSLLILPVATLVGLVALADRVVVSITTMLVVALVVARTSVVVRAKEAEIAERRRMEAALADRALHDPLTGLLSRDAFVDRVEAALLRARETEESIALLFVDVDDFKLVNDSLGHAAGDQVLVTVAERLRTAVRDGDAIARFGGDEFTILCEGTDSDLDATEVAERASDAVAGAIDLDGGEVVLGISVGIVTDHRGESVAEALLRDADLAMYEAKSRGRNRSATFDESMRASAVERFKLQAELRHAAKDDQLRLLYQPQIELATGRLFGVEALLRWDHPTRGVLRPDAFIDVAEQSALVLPIGAWTIGEACRQLRRWYDRLAPVTSCPTVAVNLSSRQLAQPNLPELIRTALDVSCITPSALFIEITERAIVADPEQALANLRALKDLGVSIAVDDFGTGYFSLAQIKHYPIDILKVDRSFVGGLGTDRDDEAIVAATIGLAHSMGMIAIAEGIETAEQLALLRAMGCDAGQGFHLGRPAAAEDLLDQFVGHLWSMPPTGVAGAPPHALTPQPTSEVL